jgi:hypothetical protein
MIYRVSKSTPRFCVGLNINGCGGEPLTAGDFFIIVRRLGPGVLIREPGVWDEGCGRFSPARQVSWSRLPNRRIKYPAFEVNASGQVCFLWDNKILCGEPGRWCGQIYHCNNHIATVEFEVGDRAFVKNGVSVAASGCTPARSCPTC